MTDYPPPTGDEAAAEEPAEDKKKSTAKTIAIVVGVIVFLAAVCGDGDESAEEPAAQQTESSQTAAPAEDPTTAEPAETPTVAEPESFEDRVAVALGDSNRDIEPRFTIEENTADDGGRELVITWAIDDNFTENMVKLGAQMDAVGILQAAAESPDLEYDQLYLVGTFSMVDQLGNAEEDNVIGATYPRETIEQINFDNFLAQNAWNVANQDSLFVHPAFQPEE